MQCRLWCSSQGETIFFYVTCPLYFVFHQVWRIPFSFKHLLCSAMEGWNLLDFEINTITLSYCPPLHNRQVKEYELQKCLWAMRNYAYCSFFFNLICISWTNSWRIFESSNNKWLSVHERVINQFTCLNKKDWYSLFSPNFNISFVLVWIMH